jgi:hypothetical protein
VSPRPDLEDLDAETITVKVTREEYPLLFDHLRTITKGKRRANRLRALALRGLEVETAASSATPFRLSAAQVACGKPNDHDATAAAQMFATDWDDN